MKEEFAKKFAENPELWIFDIQLQEYVEKVFMDFNEKGHSLDYCHGYVNGVHEDEFNKIYYFAYHLYACTIKSSYKIYGEKTTIDYFQKLDILKKEEIMEIINS